MPRGRPRKPPKPSERRSAGLQECPTHLSAHAKKKWAELVRILDRAGILKAVDADVLACYCEVYATWLKANKAIAKQGEVTKGPNGGQVHNPYVAIRKGAAAEMRRYSQMLGLDPLSRQKLDANGESGPSDDGKSKFFKAREGACT